MFTYPGTVNNNNNRKKCSSWQSERDLHLAVSKAVWHKVRDVISAWTRYRVLATKGSLEFISSLILPAWTASILCHTAVGLVCKESDRIWTKMTSFPKGYQQLSEKERKKILQFKFNAEG